MAHDESSETEVLFDVDEGGWDPLADFEEMEDDESEGQLGPHSGRYEQVRYAPKPTGLTASERIERLFEDLGTRRRIMLGILAYLSEPRRADALQAKVDELQAFDKSVYDGFGFSLLLEEAGAIERVAEDGSPFDEEAEQAPDIVVIDGVRFYKPTDGKQVFWVDTDEGRAYLEADNPRGRMEALFAEQSRYAPIYRRVLELCAAEGGSSRVTLEAAVESDPLVQDPRRYCSFFTKGLEDVGALTWAGSWKTTDVGLQGLGLLDQSEEA